MNSNMRKISFFLPSPFLIGLMVGIGFLFWAAFAGAAPSGDWRIKILDAAVVKGDHVTLGEIAQPLGDYPKEYWQTLEQKELWPAPEESGRPMSISKVKIKEQLRSYLVDDERICIYPPSLAIQQGGAVMREDDLKSMVSKYLTALLVGLPGEVNVSDIKVPPFIFLAGATQKILPSLATKPNAGRASLRFEVKDIDGSTVKRYTGSAFIDVWATVPCAAVPLNREDVVDTTKIVFKRKNLAVTRGDLASIWDGQGGPYRITRAIGEDQIIYQSDLSTVPVVRRGSEVNLVYNKGNLQLTVRVQAQGDAGLGDNVVVRNLQSKKLITAVVKNSGTVAVN